MRDPAGCHFTCGTPGISARIATYGGAEASIGCSFRRTSQQIRRWPSFCTYATPHEMIFDPADVMHCRIASSLGPPDVMITSSVPSDSWYNACSTNHKPQSTPNPITSDVIPSPISPAPKHNPISVTNHSVAAVVTPTTRLSRRRIVPPPMKPMPERIPSGNRIGSILTNESEVMPLVLSRMLHRIIASAAETATRMVVRIPAGRPRSPRLNPIIAPARIVRINRSAIAGQ
jgi:hypothetical protein